MTMGGTTHPQHTMGRSKSGSLLQKSRLVGQRVLGGDECRTNWWEETATAHSGYSIIGGRPSPRGGTRGARTCVCSAKERAGEGRFCLDKGNYSRDSGMPRWRVVNKQSNLITVTSYTPFRHQRVWSKCLSRNSCLCGLPQAWAGREVIGGTFHVSRGLKHPTDTL